MCMLHWMVSLSLMLQYLRDPLLDCYYFLFSVNQVTELLQNFHAILYNWVPLPSTWRHFVLSCKVYIHPLCWSCAISGPISCSVRITVACNSGLKKEWWQLLILWQKGIEVNWVTVEESSVSDSEGAVGKGIFRCRQWGCCKWCRVLNVLSC